MDDPTVIKIGRLLDKTKPIPNLYWNQAHDSCSMSRISPDLIED